MSKQVEPPIERNFNNNAVTYPAMQSTFFGKNINNNTNSPVPIINKGTPIIPPLDQEQFSNNVLNIGFIAEDSKLNLSQSSSVHSFSAVSEIRPNPKEHRTYMPSLAEEIGSISGMEEWPSPEIPFPKRNFKRNKPQILEDELQQLANNCTKKKMGERNRVLTINTSRAPQQARGYKLRSRSKLAVQQQSSSNEDIREMLLDIEKQEKVQSKPSKIRSK